MKIYVNGSYDDFAEFESIINWIRYAEKAARNDLPILKAYGFEVDRDRAVEVAYRSLDRMGTTLKIARDPDTDEKIYTISEETEEAGS